MKFYLFLILAFFFSNTSSFADPWSIDQFLQSLKDQKPKSVEEALLSLPESVRSHFALYYDGHGLRGTSYEKPGALVYSAQGDYALTFGDASMDMGQDIELAIFRPAAAKFEYYRASFPATGGVTVEKNPRMCLSCHQSDPMFRWGSYLYAEYDHAFWPGIYGSMDDEIAAPGSHPGKAPDWPPYVEYPHFTSFMSQMKSLERYRTLKPIKAVIVHPETDDDSPVSPYSDVDKDPRLEIRPNNFFTEIVARQDGRRLARKLMEAPLFAQYQYWLIYKMLGCGKNDGALAPPTSSQLNTISLKISADLLKSALSDTEKSRLAKDPLSVETIFEILGVTYSDLQPDILRPVVPGVYPFFYDGIQYDQENALGVNSVDYFATHIIFKSVLASAPDAGLQSAYRTITGLGEDLDYFKDYPESLQMDASMDALANWIDWDFAKNNGMCDSLTRLNFALPTR